MPLSLEDGLYVLANCTGKGIEFLCMGQGGRSIWEKSKIARIAGIYIKFVQHIDEQKVGINFDVRLHDLKESLQAVHPD